MRLDLFLKSVCLVKQRSEAKKLCDGGHVRSSDQAFKASHSVHEGEVITINFPKRTLTIEIAAIPAGQVSKSDAKSFYTVRSEERNG